MMWHDGWSAGGWMLMALLMIVFWALVVAGVVWLARNSDRRRPPAESREPAARQILDERFARGELTEQEYRQRREVLNAR